MVKITEVQGIFRDRRSAASTSIVLLGAYDLLGQTKTMSLLSIGVLMRRVEMAHTTYVSNSPSMVPRRIRDITADIGKCNHT